MSEHSDVRGLLGILTITAQDRLFCLQVSKRRTKLPENRCQVGFAVVAPQICLPEQIDLIREEEKLGASCRPPHAYRAWATADPDPLPSRRIAAILSQRRAMPLQSTTQRKLLKYSSCT
jgi:hypothetical protein